MSLKMFSENHLPVEALLNAIKVGVFLTDGAGNVLFLNEESEKTGGMSSSELIGRNMVELEREGYVVESSVLKALRSGHEESLIQELGEGGKLYLTATPIWQSGKIAAVVCTERDITETMHLRELLRERQEITQKYEKELELLRRQGAAAVGRIVARSREMNAVIEKALRVAKLDMTVLLTGESGTGKELLANVIYENSERFGKPFIKINCAAIPETLLESELFGYEKGAFTGANKGGKAGIFELAAGGTLFLDEIAELSTKMQAKLLRALQEKEINRVGGAKSVPVDVRIIAATNKSLNKEIGKGSFREDLFYRLNVFPIETPPLRSRREDVGVLTSYFIEAFCKEYQVKKTITEDAVRVLEEYEWPGNVRELRNVLERIVVGSDSPTISRFQVLRMLKGASEEPAITKNTAQSHSLQALMANYEKEILLEWMMKCGSAAEVSRALKVDKSTICRKLKRYRIE